MARLDFSSIFKRSSALTSTNNKTDKDFCNILEQLKTEIDKCSSRSSLSIVGVNELKYCIEELCNKTVASDHYSEAIDVLQWLRSADLNESADNYKSQYINRILPYTEDVGRIIDNIDSYDLPENDINNIKEAASDYLLADRILTNHSKISKRFNIEHEISKVKSKGMKTVVESCCSMIDTYNIRPYQKFSMCIDEITYLFEKNHVLYDQDDLCSTILEYFLLRMPNIDEKEMNGFRYTLENNRCVDDVKSTYKYITESFETTNIRSCIRNFLKSSNKTLELYENSFVDIISKTSIVDIKSNYNKLLEFGYNVYTSDLFSSPTNFTEIRKVTDTIFQTVFQKCSDTSISDDYDQITRDDLSSMIDKTKYVASCIPVNSLTDDDIARKADFKDLLANNCLENCYSLYTMLYDKKNLEAIKFVNEDSEESIPLKEFKIFKFNNLIKATHNLDKYLNRYTSKFGKKIHEKLKKGATKIRSILFEADGKLDKESIYNFIGNDSKVDFCMYQIETTSENDVKEVQDELIDICDSFNYQLKIDNLDSIRAYYILNGCVAELHLKDSTNLILTEEDWNMVNISDNSFNDIYIEQLGIFDACNKVAENFDIRSLDDTISSVFMSDDINMSLEAYNIAMDALSLMGASKYQAESFTDGFSYYINSGTVNESTELRRENVLVRKIYESWEPEENIPYDIQVEAADIFLDIISEAAPKIHKVKVGGAAVKKDKPDVGADKDNDKESKPKGVEAVANKLNNIKLYLHGLRGKAKQMNQKEKEASRNLDAAFNNFVKSVKNALVSDRREAIIKGSVIPSFSRSLKIATSLAVSGLVTGNPVVPLVAALGGFAASKKLTKRERMLLLDEIETELEVVEKEIANADAKNQIKKYRQLLQYKKDLQRQYQRIKYNIKVGKDILPGSAAGFKDRYN